MSSLKIWTRIPDNSVLHIEVDAPDEVAVAAALVSDDGEAEIDGAVLRAGEDIPLVRPNAYALRLWMQFMGNAESTAEIFAVVRKPDGSHYGEAYRVRVSGDGGAVRRATIIAATLKGGN